MDAPALSRFRGRLGGLPLSFRVKAQPGVRMSENKRRTPWTTLQSPGLRIPSLSGPVGKGQLRTVCLDQDRRRDPRQEQPGVKRVGISKTRRRDRRPTDETSARALRRRRPRLKSRTPGVRSSHPTRRAASPQPDRPGTRRLTPELFGRQLLEPDVATQDAPDHAHLLRLAQRLGAGEDVIAARVPWETVARWC